MEQIETELNAFETNLEQDSTYLLKKDRNYVEFLENFNKFVNKIETVEQIK